MTFVDEPNRQNRHEKAKPSNVDSLCRQCQRGKIDKEKSKSLCLWCRLGEVLKDPGARAEAERRAKPSLVQSNPPLEELQERADARHFATPTRAGNPRSQRHRRVGEVLPRTEARMVGGSDKSQPCLVEGCEKPRFSRGWCTTHYFRMRDYGSFEGRTA